MISPHDLWDPQRDHTTVCRYCVPTSLTHSGGGGGGGEGEGADGGECESEKQSERQRGKERTFTLLGYQSRMMKGRSESSCIIITNSI